LNSSLKRIDLALKFSAPFLVSLAVEFLPSQWAAVAVAGWVCVSMIPEIILIGWVYRAIPELALPKTPKRNPERNPTVQSNAGEALGDEEPVKSTQDTPSLLASNVITGLDGQDAPSNERPRIPEKRRCAALRDLCETIVTYPRERVFLPSLAYAMIWLTVLSFGSVMTACESLLSLRYILCGTLLSLLCSHCFALVIYACLLFFFFFNPN
jgi:hypothetical protein